MCSRLGVLVSVLFATYTVLTPFSLPISVLALAVFCDFVFFFHGSVAQV